VFNKYYQQQLQNLRELAQQFSKVHPAIAPLLSGPSSDPDVERLLEGVSFLTGLLQQKLDDEFPEIIHGLTDVIFPHYLRPVPSSSIVVFAPKPSLQETIEVPAGTSLGSIPVEGTKCIFRTCFDLEVHPLKLVLAELVQNPPNPNQIRLVLELSGPNLTQWQPRCLSFLLGGSYTQATDLFLLLTRYVRRIIIKAGQEGSQCILPPHFLLKSGFELQNSLLSYPAHAFAGFRLLQEYFILPHKFLFLELRGWENWQDRGESSRFEIVFELEHSPLAPPKIKADYIIPFATPVINLFAYESDPILLDPRLEKVRVRPATKRKEHFQVFSVDKVVGHKQGSVTSKEYSPLESFFRQDEDSSVYQVVRTRSPIDNSAETYLSFTFPARGPEPEEETLSLSLTCTNGTLPELLQLGDIRVQSSDSPGLLDFYNIIPPTSPLNPPLGKNTLWKLLSHLSLNFLPLADPRNLIDLLKLYISPEGRDRAKIEANLKRIEGIVDFSVKPADRIVDGLIMRGQKIQLTVRQDHFAGIGDLFLFGSVLDLFFGIYSSMNTFTQFELIDNISGETFLWPVRIGEKALI